MGEGEGWRGNDFAVRKALQKYTRGRVKGILKRRRERKKRGKKRRRKERQECYPKNQ